MADISKITPPGSQTTYNLKDATAREQANWNTNNGVKNLLKNNAVSTVNNTVTFTVNNDKSIRVQGKPSSGISEIVLSDLSELVDGQTYKLYGNQFTKHTSFQIVGGTGISNIYATPEGTEWTFIRANYTRAVVRQDNEATTTDATIYPMITIPTITDSTYQPYSLPNTKITPELIELVDSGAKNKLKVTKDTIAALNNGTWRGNVFTPAGQTGLTLTINSDGSISTSGAPSVGVYIALSTSLNTILTVGETYALSGCTGGSSATYGLYSGTQGEWDNFNGGTEKVYASSITTMYFYVRASASVAGKTFYPMICSKAAWDVSQKFVPYRPTYEDTVEQVAENENNISSLQSTVVSYTDVVIDLHDDVTWAQGVQGIYYSTTVTVPNMNTIYAVSITSLSSIPNNSGLIPRIDGTTKIGLYADTGTWVTSQRVTIRVVGIEST